MKQPNFTITPSALIKAVGVSKQRISQYIQNKTLIEGKHYIKAGTKFYLYSREAYDLLKDRRKRFLAGRKGK